MSNSATPWTAACQASLSITISRSSLKLMSIELVMPSSHLILCHLPLLLPPIPPSMSLFQSTLCIRWPKYRSFSFSIIPSKEHPGLRPLNLESKRKHSYRGKNLETLTPDVKVKVAQLCPALCDQIDYTVHGILQARILEWVAVPFSRGSS